MFSLLYLRVVTIKIRCSSILIVLMCRIAGKSILGSFFCLILTLQFFPLHGPQPVPLTLDCAPYPFTFCAFPPLLYRQPLSSIPFPLQQYQHSNRTAGINGTCPYQARSDQNKTRVVVVPTVAAVIIFVLAALTFFVKCAANRREGKRGRRRRQLGGWEYEGVPS